jgi:hypothetical protein
MFKKRKEKKIMRKIRENVGGRTEEIRYQSPEIDKV